MFRQLLTGLNRQVSHRRQNIDRQSLYKTIVRCQRAKDMDRANRMFRELDSESVLVDDLALTYLIEGNGEENNGKKAFDYLIYVAMFSHSRPNSPARCWT